MNSPSDPGRRPLRPADLHRLRAVADVVLHPEGDAAVYTVGWPDRESDANRSNLYRVGLDGADRLRLTEGHHDSSPRFSPDGTRLAFVRSAKDEPGRLMVMDWPSGELQTVAEFADGGPVRIDWLDGRHLLALAAQRPEAQEDVDDDERKRRPKIIGSPLYRFNGRGYHFDRPNQLWGIDLYARGSDTDADPAAVPSALGQAGLDHDSFAVSPDGSMVVAIAPVDDTDRIRGGNRLLRYDLTRAADGAVVASEPTVLTPTPGVWAELLWHPTDGLFVVGSDDLDTIEFNRLHRVDPSEIGAPIELAFDDVNITAGPSTGAVVEGGILATGPRRGRVGIDRYSTTDGSRSVVYEDDSTVVAFAADPTGTTLVAAITSATRPAELWRIDGGTATRLVTLNAELLAQLDLVEPETVAVTSADGTVVEAFVTRPPASAPDTGDPRPGLVYVHGGPMFQYGHFFFDEFQIAAALGYVVIGGNPRGSDGYGEAWARDIIANFGNRDWQDVQAITGHLAGLAEVDENRIGIGGGSYGGFMTCWALAHDDDRRYKAGLVERSVVDFVSMTGTSDIGHSFVTRYLGASIDDDPGKILCQSPLTFAHNISVPTLVLHSEEDWRCPIEQAERLHATIHRNSDRGGSSILVRFPAENHELSRSGQPRHRVERFEIIHEFYARHLGGADLDTAHLP